MKKSRGQRSIWIFSIVWRVLCVIIHWSRKLAPPSQPIRFKTQTIRDKVTRLFRAPQIAFTLLFEYRLFSCDVFFLFDWMLRTGLKTFLPCFPGPFMPLLEMILDTSFSFPIIWQVFAAFFDSLGLIFFFLGRFSVFHERFSSRCRRRSFEPKSWDSTFQHPGKINREERSKYHC